MYNLLWNSSKKNEQKSVRQLGKYRVHQRMLVALVAEVPNLERAVGSAQEPCAAITAELKVANYPVPVQLSRQLTVRLKMSVDVICPPHRKSAGHVQAVRQCAAETGQDARARWTPRPRSEIALRCRRLEEVRLQPILP